MSPPWGLVAGRRRGCRPWTPPIECRPCSRPASRHSKMPRRHRSDRPAHRRAARRARRRGLTGFIMPRTDQYQSEYLPAIGRAARLAHRLHRLGRAARSCSPTAPRSSSTAAIPCRCAIRSIADLFAVEHLVDTPPETWLEAESRRPARSSATIPGCTRSKAPSGSPRPAPRPTRNWCRPSPIRSTRSGRIALPRRSAR